MRWLYIDMFLILFCVCQYSFWLCSINYVCYLSECNVAFNCVIKNAQELYNLTKQSQPLFSRLDVFNSRVYPSKFDCEFVAGYLDGDGSFGGKKQVIINFTTHADDLEMLLYFRDRWGGRIDLIYLNTIRLSLSTSETAQLLLDCGKYLQNADRIQLGVQYGLDKSTLSSVLPTKNSAWFLGFIASDGSFVCNVDFKAFVAFTLKSDTLYKMVVQVCGNENVGLANTKRAETSFYTYSNHVTSVFLLSYLKTFTIPGTVGKAAAQAAFITILELRIALTKKRQWSSFIRTPSEARIKLIKALTQLSLNKAGDRHPYEYWENLCNAYRVKENTQN